MLYIQRAKEARWMKRLLLTLLFLVASSPALAQVPGPRVSLAVNPPPNQTDCSATSSDPWTWVYQQACYLPTGITAGTPWISHLRITFTSTSGTQLSSVLVPRGQVVRETTTARCPGGATPCMRVDNIVAPAGNSNITLAWITAENIAGGASTAIPFTAAPPVPPAMSGARVVPE